MLDISKLQNAVLSVDFGLARQLLDDAGWEIPLLPDDASSLRAACIASEVADYFGDYKRAKSVLTPYIEACDKAFQNVGSRSKLQDASDQNTRLLKQKVWAVLHRGFTYYREGRFGDAMGDFSRCREFVQEQLVDNKKNPCFGTLARISYAMGLVHRQCYRYEDAKREFTQCISLSWQHLEHVALSPDQSTDFRPITAFHVAKALALGLSWIRATEGHPRSAKPLIEAARVMLATTKADICRFSAWPLRNRTH